MAQGDFGAALAGAAYQIAGTLRIGAQDHFYLEGQVAIARPGEDGQIHIVSSTQHPSEVQHLVAHMLHVSSADVTVEVRRMGGAVQAAVFPRFKDFGRMVMCGMVAQYNEAPGADAAGAPPGPNLGPIVRKRLRIQGFIVSDTGWARYPQFRAEMLGWMREGKLHWREDVVQGLANAPKAFIGLLKGENFGKLVVKVD
jgi:NADPH-dependent curcumin reductase CurA